VWKGREGSEQEFMQLLWLWETLQLITVAGYAHYAATSCARN